MGWDSYHVPTPINRKHECDKANTWDEERSSCRVLKSCMKGRVWYGACEYTNHTTHETKVFGSVCLTDTDKDDYCHFSIKMMDESMGPCYNDCPVSIINLLTPTENEAANRWRKCCVEAYERSHKKLKKLNELPIGSTIKFFFGEKEIQATKCLPAHQFKKPWWSVGDGQYVKKKNIPDNFMVVG